MTFSKKLAQTNKDHRSSLDASQLESMKKLEENKNLLDDGEPQQPTE